MPFRNFPGREVATRTAVLYCVKYSHVPQAGDPAGLCGDCRVDLEERIQYLREEIERLSQEGRDAARWRPE